MSHCNPLQGFCTIVLTIHVPLLQGCKKALEDWVKANAIIVIGVGIGIACLEVTIFPSPIFVKV